MASALRDFIDEILHPVVLVLYSFCLFFLTAIAQDVLVYSRHQWYHCGAWGSPPLITEGSNRAD